ncbi:MAG TPA: hypothetical protein VLM17_11710 [Xanthomonadaceae bacterium]|nr:hypothetical protein [Xanthomonadaceae bacterium]
MGKAVAKKTGTVAAKKSASKAVAKKSAGKPAAKKAGEGMAPKTAGRKSTQAAAPRKTARTSTSPRKPAAGTSPVPSRSSQRRRGGDSSTRRQAGAPPEAREATRRLLEAKQARERETPPWQQLGQGEGGGHAPHAGFQSDEARTQAYALHNDEMDLPAVQGHVSDQNRQRQGRRDHRTASRH